MTHAQLRDWLDRYIDAWRANDREPIAALFTQDAIYRYNPYRDLALRGNAAIADGWLEEGDDPDSWEASYQPYAIDGDRAVATGWSRYAATAGAPARRFHKTCSCSASTTNGAANSPSCSWRSERLPAPLSKRTRYTE